MFFVTIFSLLWNPIRIPIILPTSKQNSNISAMLWGYFFKRSDSLSVKVKSNKLSLAFFSLWVVGWANGRHQHSKCLFPLTTILSLSPNFSDPISSIPVSCSNGPTHLHAFTWCQARRSRHVVNGICYHVMDLNPADVNLSSHFDIKLYLMSWPNSSNRELCKMPPTRERESLIYSSFIL